MVLIWQVGKNIYIYIFYIPDTPWTTTSYPHTPELSPQNSSYMYISIAVGEKELRLVLSDTDCPHTYLTEYLAPKYSSLFH